MRDIGAEGRAPINLVAVQLVLDHRFHRGRFLAEGVTYDIRAEYHTLVQRVRNIDLTCLEQNTFAAHECVILHTTAIVRPPGLQVQSHPPSRLAEFGIIVWIQAVTQREVPLRRNVITNDFKDEANLILHM